MKTVDVIVHRPSFQFPAVRGTIGRRILVNYRCDPKILGRFLPAPFRPKLVDGHGIAGICLIRLAGIRPAFLPALAGFSSENAAHRIAVEWDENGKLREGVFIPRRDTDALLNRLAGGTFFPGIHHAAKFDVRETDDHFQLAMQSVDGATFVRVSARIADRLPNSSVFQSLDDASKFFQGGALGWSVGRENNRFDGLELHCDQWCMQPLAVELVESSFFGNTKSFPPGSAVFDSAFLMRDIEHEWHARGRLAAMERE